MRCLTHLPRSSVFNRWLVVAAVWCILLSVAVIPCNASDRPEPLPWWQAETAMGEDSTLVLTGKPWWDRAKTLAAGEHFLVKSELPDGGQMLVRCERLKRHQQQDAIVWVIDDDGDFRPGDTDGDKDNDCYVVDYDRDGRVDRMVDYMGNDGNGQADEMDMRYFSGGQLRRAWFGVDIDRDGHMWNAACYEYRATTYSGDTPGHPDPYDGSGDSEIIVNKYDPEQRRWWPISECPFAWYDTDGDGESEVLIRVAAIPQKPYPPPEADGGNSHCNSRPFQARLRDIGVGAIRYCVDVTGNSSPQHRVHYDLSLNMTSSQVPYEFDGMNRHNPLRRQRCAGSGQHGSRPSRPRTAT